MLAGHDGPFGMVSASPPRPPSALDSVGGASPRLRTIPHHHHLGLLAAKLTALPPPLLALRTQAMEPKVGPVGTLAAARMIRSHVDARVVGICDDPEQIVYFQLTAGEAKFVNGEYYQLYKVDDEVITH